MEFLWHREAIDEADIAAGFYRDKKPELALRFLNSRDEAMGRIEINPAVYREVEPGIRKCKLRTVPYAAIYRTRSVIGVLKV